VDQAIALCWLFHLVGDLHQLCTRPSVTPSSSPRRKRPRRQLLLRPNSRHAPNLHHYWDSLLGEDDHFDLVSATPRTCGAATASVARR